MKCICLRLTAVCSLLLVGATAGTRPHYGGTLRFTTSSALASLDPAEIGQTNSISLRDISSLLFDTLVVLDSRGSPQPGLAVSWTSSSASQHWQFELRRGVTFSDGAPVTSAAVAASLRKANPDWKVIASGDNISVELESPVQNFPAELALTKNSIVRRDSKPLLGTGPFVVSQWDQARKLTLVARDDYWGGRVFLDAIQIEGSQNLRDQAIALELGRADLIEIAPEQSKRVGGGRSANSSEPIELMALLFVQDPQSQSESRLREALSLSMDRGQLNRVVLQTGGEPAGSLLPNWMTGYSFLFSVDQNLSRAKQLRSGAEQARAWTLAYDTSDVLARVVAERILLNARDAGLNIQPVNSSSADVRLLRVPLASLDSRTAFRELANRLRLPQPKSPIDSADALYSAENTLLQSRRIIPLLHLRYASAVGANVQNWSVRSDGSWNMPQVWLTPQQP
jgi:peptide/nickel transport system substrate-binding protein